MVSSSLADFNSRVWTRRIVNNYWFVLLVSVIVECISMTLSSSGHMRFIQLFIVLPSALLLAILLGLEFYIRMARHRPDYAVIIAGVAISTVIVATHSTEPVTTSIFLLPILIASFYFEPRKVVVTCGLSFVSILLLYVLNEPYRAFMDPIGLVTVCSTVVAGCLVAIEVMKRGVELVGHLRETQASNERLRVQNIVMESLSKLDGLTDAYNHKTFHEHLGELIARSTSFEESIFLLLADIDDFKRVNDTFGHHVGDVILRRVAQSIKSQLSANDFLARYGGEEFAVIMVGKTQAEALRVAEQICLSIASQTHEEVNDGVVTLSIGVSQYESGKGKDSLFVEADQALYRAKHSGKNQVCLV